MTSLFEGKTVLVTGGASGIGRAAAEAFGAAGARVIVADLDEVKAAEVAAATGKGSIDICLDAGRIVDIAKTIESVATRVGRIDILINNAAAFEMAPILEVTPESFERLFRVNVEGMFFVMQAVAGLMAADGKGGVIINMASQAGRQGEPASSVYAATKAAVICFTRSAALALINDGIRVNAIAPGVIETAMWDKIDALYAEQYGVPLGEKRRQVGRAVPIGRMGTPGEVAAVAVFLASVQAAYIVGQTINVDGGNIMS